ncbi:MAG: hypothetical protein ACLFTU_10130 [Puniceicoccaceae bacterium]
MVTTSERVDRLEGMMAEVAHAQMRTEMSLLALSNEMREFKEEMREFKVEMREFKDEMREFKDEMREFKEEMREFKEESQRDRKRMNKAWGDLANKLGTTVEDIVAPNLPRIAREEFDMGERTDLLVRAHRVSRRGREREREYDIVCAGAEKVLVVEVKSSPARDQIPDFLASLEDFADFYPEYGDWERIGIFASWSLSAPIRKAVRKAGLYGLAMGDETMEIVIRP